MPEAFVREIQPPLDFIPPDYNPWLRRVVDWLLPLLMRRQLSLYETRAENVETLAELYRQFAAGETRFLLAFRHPSTTDPFAIAHLLWKALPRTARQRGIALPRPTHVHFVYDRGIPLWAGPRVGWFLSQMGGSSIQRGKLDRKGLRSARNLLARGAFPLAISPEGATNNHNELVSPLEPGVAQLAFWCLDDLRAQGKSPRVAIAPLGIQYEYLVPPWGAIDRLLEDLEADLGLEPLAPGEGAVTAGAAVPPDRRYLRLYRLGDRLLRLMTDFYRQFYGRDLPDPPDLADPNARMNAQLKILLGAAMSVAEDYFRIKPNGDLGDRCRRLEQAGWERIYREDAEALAPVERGLANWVAGEASFRMGHMRLVERFASVTGDYVRERPTAERFADTLLILWRVSVWVQGGDPSNPPNLGPRRACLRVGEPIWASDRYDAYQRDRRGTVARTTGELQAALEGLIR